MVAATGRLAGKVVLISGGGSGMGRASALLFAEEGASVGIVDIDGDAAQATARDVTSAGGRAAVAVADVSQENQVRSAVSSISSELGAVTTLFNHAGTIIVKPFLDLTVQEWDWLHGINVRSMFLMTRAVLPQMLANGEGSIICTSSISAVAATPNEVLYDTTKGACHMFARAIAVEYRDRGIRCNAICPGFIRTPHGLHEIEALGEHGVDTSSSALAEQQGRIGEPEDVARAALFLASDDSRFVNGHHLFVDNGFTAV
ncbi:SDR family NAD(P)-dependent oxidoreductase [Aeromicrobium sp. Leaf350]|uniref:SDR family NAD(P)-dependent oxidoreductase n=1 Tax=Aeromicrobium sp. Leaf350 TaxID=2876565 RepID=UPI001E3C013D|nr:SDR family oxidoreductase [Aeromicrobium sp. Leaf350]